VATTFCSLLEARKVSEPVLLISSGSGGCNSHAQDRGEFLDFSPQVDPISFSPLTALGLGM
jgi:hypothetical protein